MTARILLATSLTAFCLALVACADEPSLVDSASFADAEAKAPPSTFPGQGNGVGDGFPGGGQSAENAFSDCRKAKNDLEYVSTDPEVCVVIRWTCEPGYDAFDDAVCGCGCITEGLEY